MWYADEVGSTADVIAQNVAFDHLVDSVMSVMIGMLQTRKFCKIVTI